MNYKRPAGQWAPGILPSAERCMPPHLTDIFVGVLGIELGFSCFKTNTSLIDQSLQPLNDLFELCFSGSGDWTQGSAHARQILYHWATLLGCLISISNKNRLRNAREFSCIIPLGVSMRGLTEKDIYPERGQYQPRDRSPTGHGKKREKVSRPLEILVFDFWLVSQATPASLSSPLWWTVYLWTVSPNCFCQCDEKSSRHPHQVPGVHPDY